MSERRRQLALLAVLVVILAWVGWGALVGDGGDARRAVRAVAALGGSRAAHDAAPLEVVGLRISDLERKPGEFSPGRDPFRFAAVPQPQRQQPPPPQRRPPRPKQAAPQQTASQPVRRPPPINFVFLGSFGPEQRKIAVFSDKNDIFNVLEGGVLKDAFVVRKIGYESADVGFVEFPDAAPQRLAAGG